MEALLLLVSWLCHITALCSSFLVLRKYEKNLQLISLKTMFDRNNFCAHRLWFIPLSIIVSFFFILTNAQVFIEKQQVDTLQYTIMGVLVAGLIIQFNYFILKDRRR
jgi:hypothetical protein